MPEPKVDRSGVFYYNGEDDIELADEDRFLCEGWYCCLPLGDGHFAVLDPIGPYGSKREATAAARQMARQMAR